MFIPTQLRLTKPRRLRRAFSLLPAFSFLAVFSWMAMAEATGNELTPRLRRPMAMQLSADGNSLFVANTRAGSLSIVDLTKASVSSEIELGKRLSDVRLLPDGHHLLATDEASHELVLVRLDQGNGTVQQRIRVAQYPVSVVVTKDGRQAIVASLWSRRLTYVELPVDTSGKMRVVETVDLPFNPRCQLLVRDDERLIVADAFGSRFGVIDNRQRNLLWVRSFPSHNIRGLGLSPNGKMLLVVHQMLNELAHTSNNDVHWGLLMSNDLRWLPLDSVLDEKADLYRGAHMHPLGHAGSATGDPSGLSVTAAGTVVVSLGGVNEVAIGTENDFSLHRLSVGRRPTAIVTSADGQRAYVANTLDDSISIIDLQQREKPQQISLGPQPELNEIDRGELLFYDASLSHDGWMSCHSCHTDGHANGLLNDNFSDGSFGSPKRVLSLLGLTDTAPYAWNAHVPTLEQQIRNSIENTMQAENSVGDKKIASLVAFVESLQLPPSLASARETMDPEGIRRGEKLFRELKCASCHVPPTYTSEKVYDVGIYDKQGNKEFNPPSLRGVSQRGLLFHDNRADSLDAALRDVGHQLDRELQDEERRDLILFLNSL